MGAVLQEFEWIFLDLTVFNILLNKFTTFINLLSVDMCYAYMVVCIIICVVIVELFKGRIF